jgi:hypothetical protein
MGRKNPGFRFDGSGRSFQSESVARHVEGVKNPGRSLDRSAGAAKFNKSSARKAASARIAKIPEALSRHIGRVYLPREVAP